MQKSRIDWCNFTSNPVKGECPVGCSYCYVKPFRTRYGWHKDIRFYPEELEAIRKRRKPTDIFVGSTIELFHDKTIQYMPEIMDTIRACPQHRFYLLTKQPQNLIKFSPFPDNCWVGATCTDYTMFHNAIPHLNQIVAKVKFASLEPLFAPIHLQNHILDGWLDWVIFGACTGTYSEMWHLAGSLYSGEHLNMVRALRIQELNKGRYTLQPPTEWVQEITKACDKAGVPVFHKDNLKPIFPVPTNALRQEMPSGS